MSRAATLRPLALRSIATRRGRSSYFGIEFEFLIAINIKIGVLAGWFDICFVAGS